jgi:ComF family protein
MFCNCCAEQLEMLDPSTRCPRCFSKEYSRQRRQCGSCARSACLLTQKAATFAHAGPAAVLVRRLKYCDQPYLAEGIAAFMAVQWCRLKWPLPDALVPVPMTKPRQFIRGYNQSYLLAEALSKHLKVPVWTALVRKSSGFAQAGLSRKQRLELDFCSISLRSSDPIKDQSLLLVDDVMTTGTTLNACADALMESLPRSVRALTFSLSQIGG